MSGINILITIIVLLVIGAFVIGIYYWWTSPEPFSSNTVLKQKKKNGSHNRRGKRDDKNSSKKQSKEQTEIVDKQTMSPVSERRVRFNNIVNFKTFVKDYSDTPNGQIITPSYRPRKRRNNRTRMLSTDSASKSSVQEAELSELSELSVVIEDSVQPANLSESENTWDSTFGLPLMDSSNKTRLINKLRKNHDNYQKSIGQIAEYQTDRSTVIQTDVTIDPFKSNSYDGLTVKEIYDKQTEGPRAVPKKISSTIDNLTIYSSESELNGGKLQKSNLGCFNDNQGSYQSAFFSDGFELENN